VKCIVVSAVYKVLVLRRSLEITALALAMIKLEGARAEIIKALSFS